MISSLPPATGFQAYGFQVKSTEPHSQQTSQSTEDVSGDNIAASEKTNPSPQTGSHPTQQLTPDQQRQLQQLQQRDREVRAHEAAHLAAAGHLANGDASFSYQTGPDGKRYAVGGEVSINIGKEADPEDTLQKSEQIRRAALAPANPSSQDLAVAARATQMAAQARMEIVSSDLSEKMAQAEQSQISATPHNDHSDKVEIYRQHAAINGTPGASLNVYG